MKKKELTEMTTEELKAELKKQKQGFGFYMGVVVVMLGVSLYSIVNGKLGIMASIPFFFIPLAVSLWNNYKAVEKELATRK